MRNALRRNMAEVMAVPMSRAGMTLPYHFILMALNNIRSDLLLGKLSGKILHSFVTLTTVYDC